MGNVSTPTQAPLAPAPNVKRMEFYGAIALLAFGFLGVAWHEHNLAAAQQALLSEHEKEYKASSAQAQVQLNSLKQQIGDQEKRTSDQEKVNLQLVQAMQTLNAQLSDIRSQESQRIQQVQSMPVDQLAKAVADQLNLTAGSYNQSSQTLTLTPTAIRQVEVQKVQLDSCNAENQNLSAQVDTDNKILSGDSLIKTSMDTTITALKNELELTQKTDSQKIAILTEQVKVVKGTFIHRLWNTVKAPLGFVAGMAVARAL